MRTLTLTLLLFAVPALAVAQQAATDDAVKAPTVELQQTLEAAPTATPAAAADGHVGPDVQEMDVESRTVADDAALQAGDPTQQRWWWLVGAIVVAGILLAVLL